MKTSSIEPIRYLSRVEMDRMHHSALRILERKGMGVDHGKALEYLRAAGCRVDMDRRIVKFPPLMRLWKKPPWTSRRKLRSTAYW